MTRKSQNWHRSLSDSSAWSPNDHAVRYLRSCVDKLFLLAEPSLLTLLHDLPLLLVPAPGGLHAPAPAWVGDSSRCSRAPSHDLCRSHQPVLSLCAIFLTAHEPSKSGPLCVLWIPGPSTGTDVDEREFSLESWPLATKGCGNQGPELFFLPGG